MSLVFGPEGLNLGVKAGIWVQDYNLGLKAWNWASRLGIWALKLEFGPEGWDLNLRGDVEEEEGGREISPMCESIGHP